MLYWYPTITGDVTVIVPVATAQVGCVTLTLGARGVTIVTVAEPDRSPLSEEQVVPLSVEAAQGVHRGIVWRNAHRDRAAASAERNITRQDRTVPWAGTRYSDAQVGGRWCRIDGITADHTGWACGNGQGYRLTAGC